MEYPPLSEDDGDPRMAISEVAVLRPSKAQVLPPIRQVVPQINAAIPSLLTGNYPRQPCHLPVGVERLSISGSSTPSSSKSQRMRSSPSLSHDPTAYRNSAYPTPEPSKGRSDTHLTMLPGPPKQANGSYPMAGSADRRISLVSSPPSADRLRASPLLPSMSGFRSSPQIGLYERDDADQVTLPSLFGNSRGLPPGYSPRDRPLLHDSRREATSNYPPTWDYDLPSPQSVSYADYPYGQHGTDGSSIHGSGRQQLNFEMVGDYPDNRNKRRRGNLPKAVTDILRSWFYDHISHPYPSEDEKQILMARTGLSISQISNWFINARRRQLPGILNSAKAETDARQSQATPRASP